LTVEEHHIYGGLGAAVAQVLCEKAPVKMRILGLPDENLYTGASADVFAHYGLTGEGIARAMKELLGR
jgi:transketolase